MKARPGILKVAGIIFCLALIGYCYFLIPKFRLEKLHIQVKDADMSFLAGLRDSALKIGILQRSPNDFVKARITYQGQTIKGRIRLKGDWMDHLNEDKWSFRIKLKKPLNDSLQTFSVQNPHTRGYLLGYVYHKLLKREGVLSPEYRFVEVYMNNVSWGTYVLEEHFTSRMISNQNKPGGIVLKFDDKLFFDNQVKKLAQKKNIPLIRQAEIRVYADAQEKSEFKEAIRKAEIILQNYQHQADTLYNSFDPEKMGAYYAVSDLASAYHAMGWINIRFYFNFKTGKMEPVGYDGYPSSDPMTWGKPYLGFDLNRHKLPKYDVMMIVYSALREKAINEEYVKILKKITDSLYVQQFMNEKRESLDFYESELRKEYRNYRFDKNFLFKNAREIREKLVEN